MSAPNSEPTAVMVHGDWNDVAASLYFAIREQEVAVISERRGVEVQEFELLTVRDEPGAAIAKRTGQPSAGGSESISLTARIGNVGDAAREKRLLERWARRLKDLAGVDYRPIR